MFNSLLIVILHYVQNFKARYLPEVLLVFLEAIKISEIFRSSKCCLYYSDMCVWYILINILF